MAIEQGKLEQFPNDVSKRLLTTKSRESKLLGLNVLGQEERFQKEFLDKQGVELLIDSCEELLDSTDELDESDVDENFRTILNAVIIVSSIDSFVDLVDISDSDPAFSKTLEFILGPEMNIRKEVLACCLFANIIVDDGKVAQFVNLKSSYEIVNHVVESSIEDGKSDFLQRFHFLRNLTKRPEGCALLVQSPLYCNAIEKLLESFSADLRLTGARIALNIATHSAPTAELLELAHTKYKIEQEPSIRYLLGLIVAESVLGSAEMQLNNQEVSTYVDDICHWTLDSLKDETCPPYVQLKLTKAIGVLSTTQYSHLLDAQILKRIVDSDTMDEHIKANLDFIAAHLQPPLA
jgi:hypothetical protein